MIKDLYWYIIECDSCGLEKEVASIYQRDTYAFITTLYNRYGWIIVKERDNDWSTLQFHEGTFCDNRKCMTAAQELKNKAGETK